MAEALAAAFRAFDQDPGTAAAGCAVTEGRRLGC